jgi:hypothetical protein
MGVIVTIWPLFEMEKYPDGCGGWGRRKCPEGEEENNKREIRISFIFKTMRFFKNV